MLEEKYAKLEVNFYKMCGFLTCLNNIFVKVGKPVSDILERNSYIFPIFERDLSGCVPKPAPSLN